MYQSYLQLQNQAHAFTNEYIELCKKYHLQIYPGINSLYIDTINETMFIENIEHCENIYLDTVFENN